MKPKTRREQANVTYSYDDMSHVGEYKGRYHPNGCIIYFTTESGELLRWNTLLIPSRTAQVEMHANEPVTISYTPAGKDELGREWIRNVRFIQKNKKNDN